MDENQKLIEPQMDVNERKDEDVIGRIDAKAEMTIHICDFFICG